MNDQRDKATCFIGLYYVPNTGNVQVPTRRLSENSILGDLAIVNSTTYEVKKAE